MNGREDRIRTNAETKGKTDSHAESGAESGAVGAANTPTDPELQLLIDQWPNLLPSVRSAILDLLADQGNFNREE